MLVTFFQAFQEGVTVFVTDLGLDPLELNVFMKDQERTIMYSSAEVTTGAAQRGGAAQGEEDHQAPPWTQSYKDRAQSLLCVGKV